MSLQSFDEFCSINGHQRYFSKQGINLPLISNIGRPLISWLFSGDICSRLHHRNWREYFNCLPDFNPHHLELGTDSATWFPLCDSPKPLFKPFDCWDSLTGRDWRYHPRGPLPFHRSFHAPVFPVRFQLDVYRRSLHVLRHHQSNPGIPVFDSLVSFSNSKIFYFKVFEGKVLKRWQYYFIGYGVPVLVVAITLGATKTEAYINPS